MRSNGRVHPRAYGGLQLWCLSACSTCGGCANPGGNRRVQRYPKRCAEWLNPVVGGEEVFHLYCTVCFFSLFFSCHSCWLVASNRFKSSLFTSGCDWNMVAIDVVFSDGYYRHVGCPRDTARHVRQESFGDISFLNVHLGVWQGCQGARDCQGIDERNYELESS